MKMINRIKCEATIDGAGIVIPGAARPGFNAITDTWSPGAEVPGDYPYLLTDAAGDWELGYHRVSSGGVLYGGTRTVVDSSAGDFPTGHPGLVMSQGPLASNMVSGPIGNAPQSAGTSIAIGAGSFVAVGKNRSISIGSPTYVDAAKAVCIGADAGAQAAGGSSVSIGDSVNADLYGMVAIGEYENRGNIRWLPIRNEVVLADGEKDFMTDNLATLDFSAWGMAGYRANGAVRLRGTITIDDAAHPGVKAYTKVVTFDYMLWLASGVAEVVGTPDITTVFTGGSATSSTVDINATTGTLTLETAGAETVEARGVMVVENIASGR